MINSLLKDSHIAQPYCRSNFENSAQNKKQDSRQCTSVNKSLTTSVYNSKPANVSFGGFFSSVKNFNFYTNKYVKTVLEKLHGNPLLYESIYALLLTCFLRPASIMALPGDKKNKGDKAYAAAHSIASGIISFVITLAIMTPIGHAVKKLEDEIGRRTKEKETEIAIKYGMKKPKDLEKLKQENLEKQTHHLKEDSYLFKFFNKDIKFKDNKVSIKTNYANDAFTYIKKVPEIFIALPRATITIALIPVILKYVFGIEKSKKPEGDKKLNPIVDNPAAINHSAVNSSKKDLAKGGVK